MGVRVKKKPSGTHDQTREGIAQTQKGSSITQMKKLRGVVRRRTSPRVSIRPQPGNLQTEKKKITKDGHDGFSLLGGPFPGDPDK